MRAIIVRNRNSEGSAERNTKCIYMNANRLSNTS